MNLTELIEKESLEHGRSKYDVLSDYLGYVKKLYVQELAKPSGKNHYQILTEAWKLYNLYEVK